MLFILVIFVVGLVRLVATLLIRTVIITKKKDVGVGTSSSVGHTVPADHHSHQVGGQHSGDDG